MQLLLLTSQCWDAALCVRLRAKLLAELPEGALVVDYTAAMGGEAVQAGRAAAAAGGDGEAGGGEAGGGEAGGGEAGGDRGGDAPAGRRFVLLEKVRAPVSWDAGHVFWVWRCERGPPRGGAGVEPS